MRPRSPSTRAGTRTTAGRRLGRGQHPLHRGRGLRRDRLLLRRRDPRAHDLGGRGRRRRAAVERHHRRQPPVRARLLRTTGSPTAPRPISTFDADRRRLAGHLQRPGRQLGVQGAAQRLAGTRTTAPTPRPTAPNIPLSLAAPGDVKFYYDHDTHWVTRQPERGHRRRPRQLPVRAGLPGRLAAGLPALLAPGPRRRRHLHLLDHVASPPAATRPRSRSTRAGTRTTARAARPAAPTSPSPCRRPAPRSSSRYDAATHVLTVSASGAPTGNIARAQAYWVTADTIAWNPGAVSAGWDVTLHYDADGDLTLEPDGRLRRHRRSR